MGLKDLNTATVADSGIDIEIYDPRTGAPTGIVIGMLGSDSQAYLEADRKIRARTLALAKKRRDFTVGMEPDAVEAAATERMTACFLYWKERRADGTFKDSLTFDEGVELPSTKEEFARIISDRGYFWLRQQVAEEMDKVSNFLSKQPRSC